MKRNWTCTLFLCLCGAVPALAQDEVTIAVNKDQRVADFLDQVAAATGRPVLYDPKSARIGPNTMGVDMTRTVPKDRLFDTCRSILSFFELNLVPIGPRGYEIYLVIDSRSTNNFVRNKAEWVDHAELEKVRDQDGVYVVCAVPVRHIENLTTLRTALSTMVSPGGLGRVQEVPGAQAVIIMDFAPTVWAMAKLIERMDRVEEDRQPATATIELRYAEAEPMAATLTSALVEPADPKAKPAPLPRIVPYGPRNALVVHGTAADVERVRELVKALDQPAKQWTAIDTR